MQINHLDKMIYFIFRYVAVKPSLQLLSNALPGNGSEVAGGKDIVDNGRVLARFLRRNWKVVDNVCESWEWSTYDP